MTLAAALVAMVVLGVLGAGVDEKLTAISLSASGTESSRGNEMVRDHFGPTAPFAILLRGPERELDRQGPRLVRVLRRDPKVTLISPWDRGTGMEHFRPKRRSAVMLVDFHVSTDTAVTTIVPRLRRIVEESISAPVTARAAGMATVARAIREESSAVTTRGEAILAPVLLLVLLLVFRSPVAAAIPLVFGAVTVIGARGLITIVAGFVDISSFALSIGTMIGIAVGVDYALLIVSRFREELARGADPVEAASVTRMTAGRTVAFAGSILLISVLIAVLLVPGVMLVSLCAAVAPVIVVAVAGPWFVGPAILILLGENVNRWPIGRRAPARTRWLALSRRARRNPAAAAAAIGALVLLLAAPAASLSTGPVTIEELPPSSRARLDVEAIEAAVGGGWISPSVVVVVNKDGPITQRSRLASLSRWQEEVAGQPGIEAVIGPGTLVKQTASMRRMSRSFLGTDPRDGMAANLRRAGSALTRLHRGLGVASEGAQALALGSGRAQKGASLLSHGLSLADSGGSRARDALDRFRRGAHLLVGGERSLALGVSLLNFSVDELRNEVAGQARPPARRLERRLGREATAAPVAETAAKDTVEKLEAAWRELGGFSIGASDPRYSALALAIREALTAASGTDPQSGARYAAGYDGLPDALGDFAQELRDNSADAAQLDARLDGILESIEFLRKLSRRLQRAVDRLESGSERLADGSDRIAGGAERLRAGLSRLAGGAEGLSGGLSRLNDGNASLERGLSFAFRRARPLAADARAAEARISSARGRIRRGSPGLFDSGYFVLSALDGAPPRKRELAAQAIDLEGGGQAARILVVDSDSGPRDLDAAGVVDRLRASARGLAERTGMQVAVTGGVAQSVDYQRATGARLLPLMVAITAVTFVILLTILRALPLAALAITLNLMSVAAAFGVLELLTLLPEKLPFGGTHHIDPVGAAGIFGIVFGLSIDYAVFLLMRMREGWERHRDNETAIAYGLERTASVITGAATIMACVFVIFATAPIQTVAQFGISLTIAVMLDATVIRLMLVPSLMKLVGPRIWWLPAWLERRLPRLNVHGEEVAI